MAVGRRRFDDRVMTSPRARSRSRSVLLLSTVVIGLSACGAAEEAISERLVEEAVGGDVDIEMSDDGQVASIETEDGSLDIRTGGDVPDAWPGDVPLFGDGQITGSYASTANGESVVSVDYVTDRTAEDVVGELTSTYEEAGFTTASESNMGDGTSGLFSYVGERDGTTVTVSATYGEGEPTRVILGVVTTAG